MERLQVTYESLGGILTANVERVITAANGAKIYCIFFDQIKECDVLEVIIVTKWPPAKRPTRSMKYLINP